LQNRLLNGEMSMDFMTVAEIAATLKVKTSWVYTHADELGAYRIGKYLRFCLPRVMQRLDRMSRYPFRFAADKNDQEQNANKTVD